VEPAAALSPGAADEVQEEELHLVIQRAIFSNKWPIIRRCLRDRGRARKSVRTTNTIHM
jgi:hypothetical protein